MDALLPSEIARLVLGYLQEQKCEEAAKIFMDTSPLLQECRVVAQRGGRYTTKVGGLSLTDILDKYCATNAMVQEKLNKVSDCEQLKQCNDLLEQLRYLLEGSRGHRFVVNISVPSQNSPSGTFGSPIVSGNMRKRHHSNSERGKRVVKSLTNILDKSSQNSFNQNCDTVEATPLDSLPGHQTSTKQIDSENDINISSNKSVVKNDNINFPKDGKIDVPVIADTHLDLNLTVLNSNTINFNHKSQSTETAQRQDLQQLKNKCTAGTSTEEISNYCSAEAQTGLCDLLESESDINDEPIENLSILTKKLLQRTELHERIAENINKAILPVETSFREENVYENATEANISLLTDYDNAIKSVVQATETDPIFEGFLHEIFKIGETDTSPDEDYDTRQNQGLNNPTYTQNNEPMQINNSSEFMDTSEPRISDQETNGSEVPLKQRLRSSSRSQNINADDEEKESNSVLENQNAEAIMNIVNVIANKRNSLVNNELDSKVPAEIITKNTVIEPPNNAKTEIENNNEENKLVNSIKLPSKKTVARKIKTPKLKSTAETTDNAITQIMSEQEIMTMPTLILCSEKDVESLLQSDVKRTKSLKENFIPIAPKPSEITSMMTEPQPTIYLRTVNVPRHLLSPAQIEASTKTSPLLLQQALQVQQPVQSQQHLQVQQPLPRISTPVAVENSLTLESITLYGGENESAPVKVAPITSMPVISLDDSAIDLVGSGLSPLFKAEEVKVAENPVEVQPLIEVDKTSGENNKSMNTMIADAVITKHTPRTLLKSRSKNNRLSLSTPRRRNSHVRALDFNTPVKLVGRARKLPQSCGKSKSICRTGLFRSPPFPVENGIDPMKKNPSYMRVPIATRSPAPKLQGNWSKLTGIGLILGDVSTSESSPEKSQTDIAPPPVKKSWDSDLRKIVGSVAVESETKPAPRNARKVKRKNVSIKNSASQPKIRGSDGKFEVAPRLQNNFSSNPVKISPEVNACLASRIPDMLDLETPRKTEITFYVPPTPRVLNTPGDNLIKSSRSKSSHEIVIKDCIDTPEFPVTPCIVLTPKIIEEENEKKSSPYYEPSDDQTQPPKSKELVNSEKTVVKEKTTTMTITTTATAVAAMTTTTTATMATMAITTIKKNVEPKENTIIEVTREIVRDNETIEEIEEEKEEEPISEETSKEIIEEESIEDTNASDSDSGNESSDSSSSSSSNSSTSSSSSSSSCSNGTSSPLKSTLVEPVPDVSTESIIDNYGRAIQSFSKISQEELVKIESEISPVKSIKDTLVLETPAKDESNVIPEADISETPSVSESERALRRDSLTGLTSKISAIIANPRNDQPNTKTNEDTCAVSSSERPPTKPRILKVQRIVSGDGMTLQVSRMLQSEKQKNSGMIVKQEQQHLTVNNAKLSLQLEEKRRRVVAKFKEAANQPKRNTDDIRQKKTRKGAEAEKLVTSTTDNFKSQCKQNQSIEEKTMVQGEPRTILEPSSCKSEDEKTEEISKETKRVKVRTSQRKKMVQDEKPVKVEINADTETNSLQVDKETQQNATKEAVPMTTENSKGISKAKVDQVKRDLFSDEEANDQRTTRSQAARRTVDGQRTDENQDPDASLETTKNKIPGVLECLQLIPANKSEQDLHELSGKSSSSDGLSNSQTNALDVSFTYDESVPIKKRKRKYSSSELATEYTFRYPDEVHVLSVTMYEEMFKIAPKTKKKIQSPKKSPAKIKKVKPSDKNVERTLGSSLFVNSSNLKNGKTYSDNKKRNSSKRKTSPLKECRQIEKKTKPDPQALFNKIKIDEFLKSVHVPE